MLPRLSKERPRHTSKRRRGSALRRGGSATGIPEVFLRPAGASAFGTGLGPEAQRPPATPLRRERRRATWKRRRPRPWLRDGGAPADPFSGSRPFALEAAHVPVDPILEAD